MFMFIINMSSIQERLDVLATLHHKVDGNTNLQITDEIEILNEIGKITTDPVYIIIEQYYKDTNWDVFNKVWHGSWFEINRFYKLKRWNIRRLSISEKISISRKNIHKI